MSNEPSSNPFDTSILLFGSSNLIAATTFLAAFWVSSIVAGPDASFNLPSFGFAANPEALFT